MTTLNATDRANASGYGQLVLAVVGLLIIVAERVAAAFRPVRVRASELDPLTDDLARAMHSQ